MGSRVAEGDRDAEAQVVARLAPAIRLFAERRFRPIDEAHEFAQDVLMHLLQLLRSGALQKGERLDLFALGVCRNLAMERMRKSARRQELLKTFEIPVETTSEGPGLASEFRRSHVEDCISQLTERSRKVVERAFAYGDSNGEIARVLSLTEGNVRVIRHRALVQLRGCLEQPISWSRR